jgi:hypothetical protein
MVGGRVEADEVVDEELLGRVNIDGNRVWTKKTCKYLEGSLQEKFAPFLIWCLGIYAI